MLGIIIRLLLLFAPLAALLVWLNWRAKQRQQSYDMDKDFRNLLIRLGMIVAAVFILSALLYLTDERRGPADRDYIPPSVVNGKVIPGRFVDKEDKKTNGNSEENNSEEDNGLETDSNSDPKNEDDGP